MTPPAVPKVCRECKVRCWDDYADRRGKMVADGWRPCVALELLQTIGAQSPSDCRSEEMCLLAERLRKEVR